MSSPFTGLTHGGTSGLTTGDYFRNANMAVASQLLNPQSQLYQQARAYMASAAPSPGANSFLSLLQAGGGNMGASQVQARELQRGAEGRRNDFLNQFTRGLFQQNIGQAQQALGTATQSDLQQQGIAVQNKQADNQMGGFLDFLGTLGGTALGGFLAPQGQLGNFGGGGANRGQGGGAQNHPLWNQRY